MAAQAGAVTSGERNFEARYQAQLDREVARLREESRQAVEQFKASFRPPSEEEIERLLYPELSEFAFELGGRRFVLRELPALAEKKFLRLVEQKLPALLSEILSFDERLGDDAPAAFAGVLSRAATAMDLVSEACILVLDPCGESSLTRDFLQQNASTARQVRILQAQLLLNGGRDFLSRLFPALNTKPSGPTEKLPPSMGGIHDWPQPQAGSNSCVAPPEKSQGDSPSDNWL